MSPLTQGLNYRSACDDNCQWLKAPTAVFNSNVKLIIYNSYFCTSAQGATKTASDKSTNRLRDSLNQTSGGQGEICRLFV